MSTRSSAEHRATYQSHNDDADSAQLEHAVEDKLDHKTQHRVEVNGDSNSGALPCPGSSMDYSRSCGACFKHKCALLGGQLPLLLPLQFFPVSVTGTPFWPADGPAESVNILGIALFFPGLLHLRMALDRTCKKRQFRLSGEAGLGACWCTPPSAMRQGVERALSSDS